MNKLGDCITLSNYILEKHDQFISYNTLRRFFGVINNNTQPSSLTLENTDYLNVEYITAIGEEVTDEQKKQMYLKHGHKGEMPLWLDEEFE